MQNHEANKYKRQQHRNDKQETSNEETISRLEETPDEETKELESDSC